MIARLKLWQKIFLITAILGIPLVVVTREYVNLVKELSLNNLNEQMTALPAIEHIGDLTRLVQDHGANLPLWVIGSNITSSQMQDNADRINALIDEVSADLAKLNHFDKGQWAIIAGNVRDLHKDGPSNSRGFTAYTEISGQLTNFAEILSYNYKFYSGAGNLFVPSRIAIDLTPSLAENINLLRGFVTYKVFVGERGLTDLSTASSYLSLAENRYQEIRQSMDDLEAHHPGIFVQLKPLSAKIDTQIRAVREMVRLYLNENSVAVEPEMFFAQSTELIGSIYDLHNLVIGLIAERVQTEIRTADKLLNTMIGVAAFAGILVLGLIFFISRSFVRGIADIAVIAEQVAGGNRQIRFPPEDDNIEIRTIMGEIGRIYEAICASEEKSRKQSEDLREANGQMAAKTVLLNEQQLVLQQVNQELEEQRSELEAQNEKLEVVIENLAFAKKDAETKGHEADVANRYKSIFLANMSHELRTPLNSIMILAQVLAENREKTMTENQIKNSNIIHNSGKDLLKLINEILDLSRIEAGKIDIKSVAIPIAQLAEETQEMYEALARNKHLQYTVAIAPDTPETIHTDAIRLAQIIRNFVANAIKFTEVGCVSVRFLKPLDSRFWLQIDVSDTGVGIPEEKREVIFEPFRQLDNTLARKQEGTGLGLAISKNLTSKLGGEIEVSSAIGKGSTFSIFLPKAVPVEAVIAPEGGANGVFVEDDRNLRTNGEATLLVIEDDRTFAELILTRCRAEGFRCVVSANGRDCVPFAEAYHPHGIILDLKLPDIDGLDVLSALKSNSKTRHIPVHVFSGTDRESEALRLGATEFLSKPISIERLDRVLKSMPHEEFFEDISLFLHSVDRKMAKAKLPRPKVPLSENQFEGKHILIVDDDIRNVYSLRQILHGRGCTILVATNGREALEVLNGTETRETPVDLVLMDIMMPEMDGYEAMRRIRVIPSLQELPIIALTAKAMKDDRELCMEAGANDYLLKPIDTDKLIMLMRVWLGS